MKKGFIVFGTFCIILGIICLIIGITQDNAYNENSVKCDAIITDIDTHNPAAAEGMSYNHTYYGKYQVNGKTYTDIKILFESTGSKTPNHSVGQTISIVVDKNNPTQLAENGIVAYVVCAVMILSGAFFIFISTLINKNKT